MNLYFLMSMDFENHSQDIPNPDNTFIHQDTGLFIEFNDAEEQAYALYDNNAGKFVT